MSEKVRRALFRPLTVKPVNPKNGDRYIDENEDTFIFKYGSWVKIKR